MFDKTHTGLDLLCEHLEYKAAIHEAEVTHMRQGLNVTPWEQCHECAKIAVQCNHQFMAQSKSQCFFTKGESDV